MTPSPASRSAQPRTGTPASTTLFPSVPARKKTPAPPKKTTKKPTAHPQELLIPSSDAKTITDQIRAQVGMAMKAALRTANAPTNVAIMSVRQNMTGNVLLTPAPNSSILELLQYADTISTTSSSVNPSLQPPHPVEKWHKLAIHGVPTELYPDTKEGMRALQADIEQQNYVVQLTQLPRYMSHPDKRAGKAASSIIIAIRTDSEAVKLKRTHVNVNYAPRRTTD
jgi:hypothetical protein